MVKLENLKEAMIELEGQPRSYSGRFMYGKSCVGVTIDRGHGSGVSVAGFCGKLAVALMLMGEDENDVDELFDNVTQDSMGRGYIVYFPDVEWVKSDDDSDDEEEDDS